VTLPGPDTLDYLSAADAAALLRVKPQTLYTYVSRGLIRSMPQADSKSRLYLREDVQKLRERNEARTSPGAAAESALRWGQPVIDTAITEITPDGPRYRGHAAIDLAREGVPYESVAELLWSGIRHAEPLVWEADLVPAGFGAQMDAVVRQGDPGKGDAAQTGVPPILRTFAIATTLLGAAESARNEIRRGTTIPAARQLILTLAGCLGYVAPARQFRVPCPGECLADCVVATLLPQADAARAQAAASAVNAALVLCADHELSSSTFAARVAASTGAELRACILAAIGAHSGALLGGGSDRAEDLLLDANGASRLREGMALAERAGGRVPGFNLVAYPKGDPRARYLLELARELAGDSAQAGRIAQFIADAEGQLSLRPSLEIGLAALGAALGLPRRSAGGIWALGRTAGWIAHVMEQRLSGHVLRPRARFAGLG
jgi:citrate synthase